MFALSKSDDPHVLKITFTDWECVSVFGPFSDILKAYSAVSGIEPQTVDVLFNYKYFEDGYSIQFYWDNLETIYVFSIPASQFAQVYERLEGICSELNRKFAERRYFKKHGELPNNGRGFAEITEE